MGAVNAALGKVIASVPSSQVMDVFNAFSKITGPSVPSNLFSMVAPSETTAFNTPRVLISDFPTHRTILLYRYLARPLVATRFRDLRGTRVVAKQETPIIRFCALQLRSRCHR